MTSTQTILADRLKMAGIIAHLPNDLPLQTITAVTDALLASPIQAVQITHQGEHTLNLIQDLAERSHGLLSIGVRLPDEDERDTAVNISPIHHAGADYITSPQYDSALHHQCHTQQIPYIPGALGAPGAQAIYQKQVTLIQMRTGGPSGPDFIAAIHTIIPNINMLVDGDISSDLISDYAKAGATAVLVQSALFTHPQQTMADIITRARTLQNAWHTTSP